MRVHTWCPNTGAWPQAQNSIAFRHWYSGIPKYHLMPKFENFSSGTDTVPECWYEYLKNTCVYISALRESWLGTKCEHSLIKLSNNSQFTPVVDYRWLWNYLWPMLPLSVSEIRPKENNIQINIIKAITLGRASAIESVVSV